MVMGLLSFLGTFWPLIGATLHMHTLSSGVKVWLQENTEPPRMVAFRVIGDQRKYGLDVFWGDSRSVDHFFTSIKKSAVGPLEIVAVGDFEEKTLLTWMENTLRDVPSSPKIESSSKIVIKEDPDRSQAEIVLSYPMITPQICDKETLKQFWCNALLRKLVKKRLQMSLSSMNAQWNDSDLAFFFPQKTCEGKAECNPNDGLHVLERFLEAIQEIRTNGFTVQEWNTVKLEMIKAIRTSLLLAPDSSTLANYYSEHLASGATSWPAYAFFVNSSMKILNELQRTDVHKIVMNVIQDEQRYIRYSGPKRLDLAAVQKILNERCTDQLEILIVEETVTNTDESLLIPYNQIPVTETEEKLVWELIDKLGNKSLPGLLFVKSRMDKIKEKIQHIHPLRFLGTIFSDPYLKKCMAKAFTKGAVKSRFLAELGDNFFKEFGTNNVYPLVPGFCKKVGADADEVNNFIQAGQWEALVEYLMDL